MSVEDNNKKTDNGNEASPSIDKPKFVKPAIKVTVIEIEYDTYAHDTT